MAREWRGEDLTEQADAVAQAIVSAWREARMLKCYAGSNHKLANAE